jgi:hypothetical protein
LDVRDLFKPFPVISPSRVRQTPFTRHRSPTGTSCNRWHLVASPAPYGVETKALNRAVKRNRHRFPKDFMFQISEDEWQNLKYQIGISSSGHGGRRRRPYVFTEHGAIMAANVLNSPRAVQMAVFVVRAFLKMRALLGDKRELAQKLASLEKELKKRLDVHEAVIVTILQRVMDTIDPPVAPEIPKPRIGFTP